MVEKSLEGETRKCPLRESSLDKGLGGEVRGSSQVEAPWFTWSAGLEVEALFVLSDAWPLTVGVVLVCFGRVYPVFCLCTCIYSSSW